MADQLQAWRVWWWDADFWLPDNSTWQGLDEAKNPRWLQSGELFLCFPVAIVLIILRFIFERFIAGPIVVGYIGVEDKPIVFVQNTFCEKVYQTISKSPNAERVEGLSKQLGWPTRDVKRWFKNRRQQSKPSLKRKATESSWRFVFYLATSVYGLLILSKEPWLWDLRLCFVGHGKQPISDEIFYYYLIETGFYLSLLISLVVDVKRKDFWQMVVHHIVTIMLTTFSYYTGFFRIGSVIILLHDLSDILLESAKVFNYAKWEATTNTIFVLFAVVFNSSSSFIIHSGWSMRCTTVRVIVAFLKHGPGLWDCWYVCRFFTCIGLTRFPRSQCSSS
ncbi:Ceramide synthase 5 [Desmophyllum pertusum]|uniref:Ceramide synthase 5 n=1 Tax=Desmophyllum pertusum TaxID=174260 RepID=A0A9X0D463_9CNID|nr:Ceramide synthase 5 [Desmophyllum pertusum]